MRVLNTLALVTAAFVAGCGGAGEHLAQWSTEVSPQSADLTTPGSASASLDGRTITLVGGNGTNGCSGAQYGFVTSPCKVTATLNMPGARTFEWSYTTADTSGPGPDVFGMVVDGRTVMLSDPGGANHQSGRAEVASTASLSFFVNCTDCTDGAASATVSSLQPK